MIIMIEIIITIMIIISKIPMIIMIIGIMMIMTGGIGKERTNFSMDSYLCYVNIR